MLVTSQVLGQEQDVIHMQVGGQHISTYKSEFQH